MCWFITFIGFEDSMSRIKSLAADWVILYPTFSQNSDYEVISLHCYISQSWVTQPGRVAISSHLPSSLVSFSPSSSEFKLSLRFWSCSAKRILLNLQQIKDNWYSVKFLIYCCIKWMFQKKVQWKVGFLPRVYA